MAGPTAYTEVPEPQGVFPPFQSEHYPSQLIWLTISFVLLYMLMSKIALPRIGSILAERSRIISDDLAAAERLKQQSDTARTAYEKALADARVRAQAIASSTREKQSAEADAAHKLLEAQLNERLATAEQSIAATRTSAMGHVHAIASDTASAIVERLIGKAPAEHEIAAALGDSSGKMGKN
jgi:F-type H+-transporting ATPase subunit b